MSLIQHKNLTYDLIKEIFDQSAHETSIDSEGDIYFKGDGIEYPVWVCLTSDKMINVFIYTKMKPDVLFEDAIVFTNDVNQQLPFLQHHYG